MTRIPSLLTLIIAVVLAVLGGRAITAQDTGPDKYTVQVPGGSRSPSSEDTNAGRSSPSATPANR